MKVCIVHVPYQHRGGEDVHVETLAKVYEKMGLEVLYFPKNRLAPVLSNSKMFKSLNVAATTCDFDDFFSELSPDFFHIHNLYPLLGPRFLKWIVSTQKKAIMTIHNHRFYCSNGLALRGMQTCKLCMHSKMKWKPVMYNCNQDMKRSLYYAAALSESSGLLMKAIQLFIAPSPYIANELREWGVESGKVLQITNPVEIFETNEDFGIKNDSSIVESDVFYAGRLSQEKGILNLLKLVSLLPRVRFVFAGSGPLQNLVIEAMEKNSNLFYFENISRPKVLQLIRKTKVGILPSICNEILPTFVLECNLLGKKCIVPDLDSTRWFAENPWLGNTVNTFNVEAMKNEIENILKNQSIVSPQKTNQLKEELSVHKYAENLGAVLRDFSILTKAPL